MTYLLDTDVQTRVIFLDSINADTIMEQDTTYPNICYNSYKWYLNVPITCVPSNRMIISLIDAQFPNIFYNIREGVNNYLHMLVGTTNYDIYLPTRQYNVETLVSYINSQISGMSVTIDYVNYLLTFTTTGSSFRIYGDSTIGGVIGLNRNANNSYQTAISFANTLTLSSPFNLSGTPYLFVKILNQTLETLDGGDNNGSIARLDINAPFGHVCFFRPPTIEQYLVNANTIEMFNIILVDHHGIPLCLKNSNIQLTLRIQYIKAPETTNPIEGTIDNTLAYQELLRRDLPLPLNAYDLESEDPKKIGE